MNKMKLDDKGKTFPVMSVQEFFNHCDKHEKIRKIEFEKAKKAVINAWDKGRDGRKFERLIVKQSIRTLSGNSLPELELLQNNRGLVIEWNGRIIGIDNWGEIVFDFNDNCKEDKDDDG